MGRTYSRVKCLSAERVARIQTKSAQTPGYATIMFEFRLSGDFYDTWGETLNWLGAIADIVFVIDGEIMPDYRPAAALRAREDLERENYATDALMEWLDGGTVTTEDMRAVYTVLNRYADWLKLAGWDY